MKSVTYLISITIALSIMLIVGRAENHQSISMHPKESLNRVTVAKEKPSFQPNVSAARGRKIAQNNGCFSCHSTDGTKKTGPTWKNLYGRKTKLVSGSTIVADSSYIKQSIIHSKAKIVKDYAPIMPAYNYLSKDKIQSIIVYIKSISSNGCGDGKKAKQN